MSCYTHPDELYRAGRKLMEAARRGDSDALSRIGMAGGPARSIRLSEALDAVARDAGHASWPAVKLAFEADAMDRSVKIDRLGVALFHGQHWVARRLIDRDPEIANANLAIELALYDEPAIMARLDAGPQSATRKIGSRLPMLHLAFSRHLQAAPEKQRAMLRIAEALVARGADVDSAVPAEPGSPHLLSALYGTLGHANNIPLARWLLENGANPNDDESLYHSTELPDIEGTRLLLKFGARVDGTNALLRAIDFNDHRRVLLLLEHGAGVNAEVADHPGGQPSMMVPALHHAARRMCDGEMAAILLRAGADCRLRHHGHSPYAFARIYGNRPVAEAIERAGGDLPPSGTEALLAAVADGTAPAGSGIDGIDQSSEIRSLLTNLVLHPEKLDHVKRLVAFGFDSNATNEVQLTPLHLAGWEGLPESFRWLQSFDPDLNHINGFGGDLLSTIIHGSENCPSRHARDHIACARFALEAGVPLGTRTIEFAGQVDMAEFLLRWSCDHPGQVIEGGIA